MLQALDADLARVDRQRRAVLAGDRDERRQVGAPAGQILRELEAGARRRGVGIDRVVEQAEAVILAHALVLLTDVGDLPEIKREPHRVERGTPELAVGEAARHDQQGGRLLCRRLGALVGDVGGGRGAFEQRRPLADIARPDLQHGLRDAQPVGAVLGRDHGDSAEDLQA